MGLALDVCLGGLALGVQGVEILVQSFFGAFARIDGATHRRSRRRFRLARVGHGLSPFSVSPKKKCPEQCEPVTALATALSERYVWPSNAKPCSRTSTWSVRPLYRRGGRGSGPPRPAPTRARRSAGGGFVFVAAPPGRGRGGAAAVRDPAHPRPAPPLPPARP